MSPHVDGRPPTGLSCAEHSARRSAMSSAVSPNWSLKLISMPFSSKHLHTFRCPDTDAQCNAVRFHRSSAFTPNVLANFFLPLDVFAHSMMVSMTDDDAPARAAMCKTDCLSSLIASIFAQCATSVLIMSDVHAGEDAAKSKGVLRCAPLAFADDPCSRNTRTHSRCALAHATWSGEDPDFASMAMPAPMRARAMQA